MQRFVFYLAYPLIYLIAALPFGALYKVSDFLYYVLRLTGYRKDVIVKNLKNSFPSKNPQEIESLFQAYCRYMVDLIVETLKTLKMTEQEARDHCAFQVPAWLEKLYEEKKSIILMMGHYGNWEWAGPSFTLNTKHQLVVIYRPLSQPYFDSMLVRMRTKFGTQITVVSQTLRDMVARRKEVTATTFIADQTAFPETAYWMKFLNQDTAVFTGAEKLAIKFDYPVVYIHVKRVRRGYYEIFPDLMFEHPKETQENEISNAFMRRLEQDILFDPVPWLWSHKRWKYNRIQKAPTTTRQV